MSPYLNHRIDRFGGSFENRMRFPLAIVAKIKEKCGKAFPVFVRYSVDEWVPGGRDLKESIEVAKILEQAGVCCLDLSQCIQESPGAGFDPMQYQEGWTMYASEAIKKTVSVPIINSHTLRTPSYCEQVLREGKTDMVGLSRQMLADPYWPVKAQMGKEKEIRKCISCLVGCWQESMMAKKEIKCSINPAINDLRFDRMHMVEKPQNIAIVGGGPAGMEGARISALKGHNVTLFEASGELGGAILGCCMAPGKEKMKWYADWTRGQVTKMPNITVKYRTRPDVENLKGFDLVLVATGARSYVPDMFRGAEAVLPFEEVIACPRQNCEFYPGNRTPVKTGEKVVVWGDHYAAVDTATYLASIGKNVTIVTGKREFGSDVEVIHMYVTRKRFAQKDAEALDSRPYKYPVKVLENSTVSQFADGKVTVTDNTFRNTVIEAEAVVTCHQKPEQSLFNALREAGVPVVLAGDAKAVRNLGAAVFEGASFGVEAGEKVLMNPNGAVMSELSLEVRNSLE
jgi:NADPH-dependent 2,4-dienoyl-CoA reductase/sulfur reductase-like enzyme